MSCFLCFICHSTVHSDTNSETREKYRELVGMKLCPDSHLCHICCHLLRKLWLFKSICLRRSMEYPVLFSERGTVNLHNSQIETVVLCPDTEECEQLANTTYHFTSETDNIDTNQYVSLEDKTDVNPEDIQEENEDKIEENISDDGNDVFDDYDDTNKAEIDETNAEPTDIEIADENREKEELNRNNDFYKVVLSIEEQKAELEQKRREDKYLEAEFKCYNCAMPFLFKDTYQAHMMRHEENGIRIKCNNTLHTYFLEDKTDVNPEDIQEENEDKIEENISDDGNDVFDDYDDTNKAEIDETNAEPTDIEIADENREKEELNRNNDFYKVVLSIEEQKAELEQKRREDKYLEAEFKCYNCAMPFLFKDTYQAHMMRHEESNGEHLCPICLLRFASACVWRAHAQAHRERYSCARCGRGVAPRRRQAHRARCANTSQAICHLCSKTFSDGNGLQQHIKRFHLSKTSSKTYSCHVCAKTYNNQAAVRTHMIKHINKKFPCSRCDARFSSPYSLAAHNKQHDATPQQCAPCRLVYSSSKGLRAHQARAHHQTRLLVCQICSKTCATQRSLSSHIQTVHSTEKPFSCGLCGARYASKKSLGAHLRRHRGVEPKLCVCHICGASFQGNNKLNRHLRSVCEKNKLEEELSEFYNQE